VLTRVLQEVEGQRVLFTADRGFADVKLFALLEELGVFFIIHTKSSTKICLYEGKAEGKAEGGGKGVEEWCALGKQRFSGNTRHKCLGRLLYFAHSPLRLWITMSRARNRQGGWGVWFLASNWPSRAKRTCQEYGRRFGCEHTHQLKGYLAQKMTKGGSSGTLKISPISAKRNLPDEQITTGRARCRQHLAICNARCRRGSGGA
jgi:hypothetical protein